MYTPTSTESRPGPRPTPRWSITVAATIAWLFAVIVAYYVVHKPFDLPQVIAMAQVALDLALWAGLLYDRAALDAVPARAGSRQGDAFSCELRRAHSVHLVTSSRDELYISVYVYILDALSSSLL